MRLECKRLADKCKGQKFDRQLKGDDDLGIVVTETGKHEGCIKTCGDNAAIDCGGSWGRFVFVVKSDGRRSSTGVGVV